MKRNHYVQLFLSTLTAAAVNSALAAPGSVPVKGVAPASGDYGYGPDPIPITAEEAFDAVTTGCIGGQCYGVGKVAIADTRTFEEYHFTGTPGKVDSIKLKDGTTFTPDLGKAKLVLEGKFLEYKLGGKKQQLQVDKVAELVTSPIADFVPCATFQQDSDPDEPGDQPAYIASAELFTSGMDALAQRGVQVVITMCSSGGRSTQCPKNFLASDVAAKFAAIYEIDRAGDIYITPPEFSVIGPPVPPGNLHMALLGGYNGSDYGGDYNSSVGFPGRNTDKQPITGWKTWEGGDVRYAAPSGPSVSWKDMGLPVYMPDTTCILPY